ncbi:MAG: hypothetical protein RMJ43_07330, partial [Chloroherpetonaceae bacterium]|nr:ATP-dependent Clp protease ATP-binding subunit ClpC [Chthonomonadaceae bacterium]MDW8207633.1 hypothetical protein [Chloroherpetonaceae bacterium]
NRIDEIIVFHELTQAEILQIVDLMLDRVNKQVSAQEMRLEVSQEVKEFLASEGYDKNMGARPLRRAIQRLIEDPLAEEILRGTFRPGDTIRAEMDGNIITFRRAEPVGDPLGETLPEVLAPSSENELPPLEEPTVGMS